LPDRSSPAAETIRPGITHTPALVVDGELLAQDLSANMLADLLRHTWTNPGRVRSQPAGIQTPDFNHAA